MAFNIGTYYTDLFKQVLAKNSKITISGNYHDQVKKIKKLVKNDVTGVVSTILDFMVQSACVPINFESKNANLNKIFNNWKTNLNSDINIDIPRGFRSFTEQYFRERWESSFIVLNIVWGVIDGYVMPKYMYFSDGGQIYVEKEDTNLKTTKYYIGKPSNKKEPLTQGLSKSYLIRKPYNHWYDKYPTPYLVKKGALYHALFKENLIDKQSQGIAQIFPAMLLIKAGHDNSVPTDPELEELRKKFIELKSEIDDRTGNNSLVGAFPHDVNIENLLPDFQKILDEKITVGVDRNLLMALGLIEFKGFSTNREEAVLNPKPLVSEIEDGVADFLELIDDIVFEIQKRNINRTKFSAKEINIDHAPIKALLTDNMKLLIRSLYDRGVISKQSTTESVTDFKFSNEVERRKKETEEKLDDLMFAPVIMNQDNKERPDTNSDSNIEKTPAKKKSETDVQAIEEATKDFTDEEKMIFNNAYAECIFASKELDYDDDFANKMSMEWALKVVKKNKK